MASLLALRSRTAAARIINARWLSSTPRRLNEGQIPKPPPPIDDSTSALDYKRAHKARPPPLPAHATRGVNAVLKRTSSTCLERALVLQRWLSEHGTHKDVLVGVTGQKGFRAHAWLDGEPVDAEFQELTRLGPPAR